MGAPTNGRDASLDGRALTAEPLYQVSALVLQVRAEQRGRADLHLALNMFCQYIYLWVYVIPAADL